jgi:hypothetical protein
MEYISSKVGEPRYCMDFYLQYAFCQVFGELHFLFTIHTGTPYELLVPFYIFLGSLESLLIACTATSIVVASPTFPTAPTTASVASEPVMTSSRSVLSLSSTACEPWGHSDPPPLKKKASSVERAILMIQRNILTRKVGEAQTK